MLKILNPKKFNAKDFKPKKLQNAMLQILNTKK